MTRDDEPVEATEPGLAAADHARGNTNARVILLEYGDYECPESIQAEPLTRHLVDTNAHHLRFVYRHFPLLEVHPHAELAAEAAEAAAAQGKFWPMHHLLFAHGHQLTLRALTACAESIELDMNRFSGEMADRIYTQRVKEHRRAGESNDVRATPAFFLNGEFVDVSFGFARLEEAVFTALAAR